MSLVLAPSRPAATTAGPPRRRRRILPWLLVTGYVAHVAVRLWLARSRTFPAADPDETGYLVAARWLTGGPGADLSGNTFYQGGYALLLTPVYGLSHDPETVYRLAVLLNALVGAGVFPLGYLVLRRFRTPTSAAAPLAFAAGSLPATTFFGAYVLADAVLPVVVLCWLLALDRFVRRGGAYAAAAAGVAVAYAYTVHSRGTVLLAVHVVTLAALAWRHGDLRRSAVVGIVSAALGHTAGSVLNHQVRAALYPEGIRDLSGNVEDRVTTLDGQVWAVSGAAGQIWALVVGTWGLAGIGLVVTVAVLVRRRATAETRVMAAVLLVATCGVAYASSAALPDEHRVGNFAYGRYLSCVAVVYTLLGLAALARLGTRRSVRPVLGAAAVLAGTGVWVAVHAGDRLRTHRHIGFDFPETSFLTGDRGAFHLATASLAALGLLAGFLVVRRLGVVAVAAGLVVVNLAALTFALLPGRKESNAHSVLRGPAVGGVALDRSLGRMAAVKLTHSVWWTRLTFMDTRKQAPAPGVCTVIVALRDGVPVEASWPGRPSGWRAQAGVAWSIRWVAWRDPACADRRAVGDVG